MQAKKNKKSDGLVKGIFLAHLILVLHLGLFAALGILVAFLSGVMQHMAWILVGGMVVVALSGYLFFRHLRRQGKSIGEAMRSSAFSGRSVEISLLGGMATLRLGQPDAQKSLPTEIPSPSLQLEDPETARIREINDLGKLLQQELITPDEFAKAKDRLLGQR